MPSAFLMFQQKKLSVEKWGKDGVVKANATVQVFLDYFQSLISMREKKTEANTVHTVPPVNCIKTANQMLLNINNHDKILF